MGAGGFVALLSKAVANQPFGRWDLGSQAHRLVTGVPFPGPASLRGWAAMRTVTNSVPDQANPKPR